MVRTLMVMVSGVGGRGEGGWQDRVCMGVWVAEVRVWGVFGKGEGVWYVWQG